MAKWSSAGSLTIWFDPQMTWGAAPSGRRGRQQSDSEAAIQTCLSMKVAFGMVLRQTTGVVESVRRRVGLDWTGSRQTSGSAVSPQTPPAIPASATKQSPTAGAGQ